MNWKAVVEFLQKYPSQKNFLEQATGCLLVLFTTVLDVNDINTNLTFFGKILVLVCLNLSIGVI